MIHRSINLIKKYDLSLKFINYQIVCYLNFKEAAKVNFYHENFKDLIVKKYFRFSLSFTFQIFLYFMIRLLIKKNLITYFSQCFFNFQLFHLNIYSLLYVKILFYSKILMIKFQMVCICTVKKLIILNSYKIFIN